MMKIFLSFSYYDQGPKQVENKHEMGSLKKGRQNSFYSKKRDDAHVDRKSVEMTEFQRRTDLL